MEVVTVVATAVEVLAIEDVDAVVLLKESSDDLQLISKIVQVENVANWRIFLSVIFEANAVWCDLVRITNCTAGEIDFAVGF